MLSRGAAGGGEGRVEGPATAFACWPFMIALLVVGDDEESGTGCGLRRGIPEETVKKL